MSAPLSKELQKKYNVRLQPAPTQHNISEQRKQAKAQSGGGSETQRKWRMHAAGRKERVVTSMTQPLVDAGAAATTAAFACARIR